jgi:hypothetical protein
VYEFILYNRLITAAAALAIALIASAFAGCTRLWWRGVVYSYMPALAVAYFLLAPTATQAPPILDIFFGGLFEFVVLCLFFLFFRKLYRTSAQISDRDSARLLRVSLVLQAALAWPVITAEGFGIFSEGSRIGYLSGSASAKYFTYLALLVAAMQAPLIAQRISAKGRPGLAGATAIGLAFALSLLAGSKGGALLWLLSILALVDYRRTQMSSFKIVLAAGGIGALVVTSSIAVADLLGITLGEFFDLALSRFFLNNDARALAFDQRHMTTAADGSLLVESFRSLANLFGLPPRNPPLGILLYEELSGLETGNGANSSLMALIIYYSAPGYAALPAVVALWGVAVLAMFFEALQRTLRSNGARAAILAFALTSLQQLSQDFLAFQVLMPLVVAATLALWLYDHKYFRHAHRPELRLPTSAHKHHHSSA